MGMLGHKSATGKITEKYAKYRLDFRAEAIRAIDNYFADLRGKSIRLSGLIDNPARASSVLVVKPNFRQHFEKMVGATGIEPVTPTMST